MKLEWTTVQRKVKELVLLDYNPRKLTAEKKQKLIDSLEKFNVVEIPVINVDNVLVAGNQRVTALMDVGRGNDTIDVRMPNRALTEAEIKEYNITSNVHVGIWDTELLGEAFADINLEGLGLDVSSIPGSEPPVQIKEKEFIPRDPSVIHTDIIKGDLFEFRKGDLCHRLLCGDSTEADDVEKLLEGVLLDMVFTDPPYGLGGYGGRKKMDLKNDDADDGTISLFYNLPIYSSVREVYLWGNHINLFKHLSIPPRDTIVWRKNNFGLGRGYRGQYELCFYYGGFDGSDSDVWDVSKDSKYVHPTQKPTALVKRAIANSQPQNVGDFFGGSGSTMVGCHEENIQSFLLEFDPNYVQIIVDRMIALDPDIEVSKNGKAYGQKE